MTGRESMGAHSPILATFYREVYLGRGVVGHPWGYAPGEELMGQT